MQYSANRSSTFASGEHSGGPDPPASTSNLTTKQGAACEARSVFDTRGAADYLGVSTALLELLRVRGGGPAYVKWSRLVRYRKAVLDEWLVKHERNHT